jgi:hypothetical protein
MGIDRYAVSPGRPKGRQAQKTETVAHNSVFAEHCEVFTDGFVLVRKVERRPLKISRTMG